MIAGRAPWVRYVLAWAALSAIAALSLILSFFHLGGICLALGGVMAVTALYTFMDLGGERFSVAMVPVAVLFFVGLLVALVAVDVATRRTFPRAPLPSVGEAPAR